MLEFPGFGVSDDFGGHPMVTAQGAVAPFLDALGVDRVDIVGNSMGGGVGINFAIRHAGPGRPARHDRRHRHQHLQPRARARASGCCRSSPRTRPGSGSSTGCKSMVYDQSLVTDELIEERWAVGHRPADAGVSAAHVRQGGVRADDGGDECQPTRRCRGR